MKICNVKINDTIFKAKIGDNILSAALINNFNITHHCCVGVCGVCKINIINGLSVLGETGVTGEVKACQARILSDIEIKIEKTPKISHTLGCVQEINVLADGIVEVVIKTKKIINFFPGQYCVFTFKCFPEKSYSLTLPMKNTPFVPTLIYLHVRQHEDGMVSPEFGKRIIVGHSVEIDGPYGTAFFRKKQKGRIILISHSTGFAPNWAIVNAALRENPHREILIIAGIPSKDKDVYMYPAFMRLVKFPNITIICPVGRCDFRSFIFKAGYPKDYIPALYDTDTIYVCGSENLINSIIPLMESTNAKFYFDCFG